MNKAQLILICSLLSSCTLKTPFNKNGWNTEGDLGTWPNRNAMLDDLIKNHQLKGLSYKQLIDSVGTPEIDTNEPLKAYFGIVIDYGYDIDPVSGKYLLLQLNKDSVVTGFEVKEWKH